MKVTLKLLLEKFKEYNTLYFNSKLPCPAFSLIETYRPFAEFRCNKIKDEEKIKKPEIRFTTYIDFTEEQFRDIFVHEMIHYYLIYNSIDRTFKHNKVFKKMMNELNKKYGLNMSVKANIWKYKRQKDAPKFLWILTHIL